MLACVAVLHRDFAAQQVEDAEAGCLAEVRHADREGRGSGVGEGFQRQTSLVRVDASGRLTTKDDVCS